MTQDNLNELLNLTPKNFFDKTLTGHNKEIFMLVFICGEQTFGFATTPTQFKATMMMLNEHLRIYEKNYGPIEVKKESETKIVSPIQLDNLGGDRPII